MSETLCTLRTKGGGGGAKVVETVLWTNPSPSSTFAAQTVTLSESIDNFDYIAISYCQSTAYPIPSRIIYSVSDFKKSLQTATNDPIVGLCVSDTSNSYGRKVYYINSTTIGFTLGYRWNSAYSTNNAANPLSIVGIKNIGGIRTNEKYDILPFQNINASAIPVFSTKGTAKAIWLTYAFTSSQYRALQITNVNPYTGEINNSVLYKIDTNAVGSYSQQANNAFVVTNGSVTLTNSLSSSALRMNLAYTY